MKKIINNIKKVIFFPIEILILTIIAIISIIMAMVFSLFSKKRQKED